MNSLEQHGQLIKQRAPQSGSATSTLRMSGNGRWLGGAAFAPHGNKENLAEDPTNKESEILRHFTLLPPDDAAVRDYLTQHRHTRVLLLEATKYLKKWFGETALFRLSARVDESGTRTLYVSVLWTGAIQEVRNAMESFDQDWLEHQHSHALIAPVFTYELV